MSTEKNTEKLEKLQDAMLKKYKESKENLGFDTVSLRTVTRNYDKKEVVVAREIVAKKGDKEFIPFGIEYADSGSVGAVYKKMNNTNTSLNIEDLLDFDQFKGFVNDRMSRLENQVTKKKPVRAMDNSKKETKKTTVSPLMIKRQGSRGGASAS